MVGFNTYVRTKNYNHLRYIADQWKKITILNPTPPVPPKKGERISTGIIMCKTPDTEEDDYEVLVIQQHCTYAFTEFVLSNFSTNSEALTLLCNSTKHELQTLSTMNYKLIWKASGRNNIGSYSYLENEKKFREKWGFDSGEELKSAINFIIEQGHFGVLPWGFPKGKPNRKEDHIDSADREFKEETGLGHMSYRLYVQDILDGRFQHWRGTYQMKYYLGKVNKPSDAALQRAEDLNCKVTDSSGQKSREVLESRWIALRYLDLLDPLPGHSFTIIKQHLQEWLETIKEKEKTAEGEKNKIKEIKPRFLRKIRS
nr:putative mRNA-decapping protein [Abalone asfa-like virus]